MPDFDPNNYVDPQITDSFSQTNVGLVGESPAIAIGTIYQSLAQATGLMFQNAVATQHSQNILQQAATTQAVIQIFSVESLGDADPAATPGGSRTKASRRTPGGGNGDSH